MPFRWDAETARFRDASGQFVQDRHLAAEIERVLTRGALELEALTRRLRGGRISLNSWHFQFRDTLRDLHVMAAAAAYGGAGRMGAAARGQVGGRLRIQYAYVDRFLGDLAAKLGAGEPLGDADLYRSRLYAEAVRATYLKAQRRVRVAAGYTIQRNRTRAGDHCRQCPALQAQGWVPIGSQPDPGERECGIGCNCYYEYRRVPPAA